METTVFYIFAFAAVLGAAMCILQRSPVASAMWLMSTMFSLAAIYVLLGAQLIGALQVLVYVGAILVLFLFVVMLLNLGTAASDMRGPPTVVATFVIAGLLAIELTALWRYTPRRMIDEITRAPTLSEAAAFPGGQEMQHAAGQNIVQSIAEPMFRTYLIPFEITSILLLAALVGAVVLAKRKI